MQNFQCFIILLDVSNKIFNEIIIKLQDSNLILHSTFYILNSKFYIIPSVVPPGLEPGLF